MTRLFIAMPVDGEIASPLKSTYEFLHTQEHILKAVSPNNYHITMKFLGECEGNVVKAIESTFLEILVTTGDIPFTLQGIGAFPDIRKPSVLWAGVETDLEKILAIKRSVERFTSNFKFKDEKRDFIPHLTIARVRKGRKITGDLLKFIEKNNSTYFGEFHFGRLALFSSRLTPEGPVYTEIKSIRF